MTKEVTSNRQTLFALHAGTSRAPKPAVPVRSGVNGLLAGKKQPQPARRQGDNRSFGHLRYSFFRRSADKFLWAMKGVRVLWLDLCKSFGLAQTQKFLDSP